MIAKFDPDAIIAYDLERKNPASDDIHSLIRNIADKPHRAPVYIKQEIEDAVENRTKELLKENEDLKEVLRLYRELLLTTKPKSLN